MRSSLCAPNPPPTFCILFWPWLVDPTPMGSQALWLPAGFNQRNPGHRSKGGRRVRSGLHSSGRHPAGSPQGGWVPSQKDIAPLGTSSFTRFPFWLMDYSFPQCSQLWVEMSPRLPALSYWLPFTLSLPWKIVPLQVNPKLSNLNVFPVGAVMKT